MDAFGDGQTNYTIGRGKIYIDDRYIGNSPDLTLEPTFGGMKVTFSIDEINEENFVLWMECARSTEKDFRYEANNPKGVNINFHFPRLSLRSKGTNLKSGDVWQSLGFSGRSTGPFSYSYPTIVQKTVEVNPYRGRGKPGQYSHEGEDEDD